MSFNQSRSVNSEDSQFKNSRRSASFNRQRISSGPHSKPGVAGRSAPAASIVSYVSDKKSSDAQQGGQSRACVSTVNGNTSSNGSTPRGVQNGSLVQPQLSDTSSNPIKSPGSQSGILQKNATSQCTTKNSDATDPSTPLKDLEEQPKAFPLQFGSISPGFQIPRTISAPPNLDEQKFDQTRQQLFKSVPSATLRVRKCQSQKNNSGICDQPNMGKSYPEPQVRKDIHISPASLLNQIQTPSHPSMGGISAPMAIHQPQVSVPFGSSQMQPHGFTAAVIQMSVPMPLSVGGNPQVQQQMFVPALQTHVLQHQGQSLEITPQIGSQLAPQSGLGLNVSSQYPQHQRGNFGGPRKPAVRITDPKTHEELVFDNKRTDASINIGSSSPKDSSIVSQSQPILSQTPHSINYFTKISCSSSPSFSSNHNFLPVPVDHIASNSPVQKISCPISQGATNASIVSPMAPNALPDCKTMSPVHRIASLPKLEDVHQVHDVISASSAAKNVPIQPPGSFVEVIDSFPKGSLSVEKVEAPKSLKEAVSQKDSVHCLKGAFQASNPGFESLVLKSLPLATKESVGASSAVSMIALVSSLQSSASASLPEESVKNNDGSKKSLSGSNSFENINKISGKKGPIQPQQQVGFQSSLNKDLASQEHTSFSYREVYETVQAPESHAAKGGRMSISSNEAFGAEFSVEISDPICYRELESSLQFEPSKHEPIGLKEVEDRRLPGTIEDTNRCNLVSESLSQNFDSIEPSKPQCCIKLTAINDGKSNLEIQEKLDEPVSFHAEVDSKEKYEDISNSTMHGYEISLVIASSCRSDSTAVGRTDTQAAPVQTSELSKMKHEEDRVEHAGLHGDSILTPFFKDKPVMDMNKMRNTATRGKKKRKDILQKADTAGTTSDLYVAYKGPEEKEEIVMPAENSNGNLNLKRGCDQSAKEEAVLTKKDAHGKLEPDDWEDAVDISMVKLEYKGFGDKAKGRVALYQKDGSGDMAKKYSRYFLLKFAEQFMHLPNGFEITPEIEALMSINRGSQPVNNNTNANLGRMDRSSGGSRLDRRASGADDRWSRVSGRESHLDGAYRGNAGSQTARGAINGVSKNLRAQAHPQYAGGILSGLMPPNGSQGGIQQNGSDADRWQRAINFQPKGLTPPPTQLQMMHKAEKKYEVSKVADEEETKQRQMKGILNKLTPQNFEKLFEQVKAVNIDSGKTLTGVISQIFDKALMEPTFCEMYANFCLHLAGELPDFSEDNQKITFKRLLLNKCQEEFEREQQVNDEVDEVGEMKLSDEEIEAKRLKARRRMLGNIRLIGELYKKKMITERIMHECIKKLLSQYQNPDEEDIEALCKLMSTIGEMIDHPKAKEHMNMYFEMMAKLSNNIKLSSRVRFMLKDAIDLRKNKWQQRRKVEGPKKIEEVHRDAVQERQTQARRLGHGPGINVSLRRRPSMDFGFRPSTTLPSPAQVGFRGFSTQDCGAVSNDTHTGDKQSSEARKLSVPLPQRPVADDIITLSPKGGLARELSIRGPQSISSASLAEMSKTVDNSQRMTAGLNSHRLVAEHATFSSKGDITPRYMPERFAGPVPLHQLSAQEPDIIDGNGQLRNMDSSLDRSYSSSLTKHEQPALTSNGHSEVMSEDRLRDKSMAAIREYYSARDEKEVALCIKDLNSPSFHSSMISYWVTDSFERKNVERDLLAKLLVSLTKSKDGTLSQVQLVKGIEFVLATLEDAVNDAPKAPEFMGCILANLMWENSISLREIGKLIYEGGEEPGCLLKVGLAADVLGNMLKVIQLEKGESFLSEILRSSNLHLERFRPPDPIKSKILENFI